MKDHEFTESVGSRDATARTLAECAKSFGPDIEKLFKDSVSIKMGSATVNKREDCRKDVFLNPCAKDLQTRGDQLLKHEQAHFDLTEAYAQKAQNALRAMIGTFPAEVEACGKDAAEAKAKTTLTAELKKLKGSYAPIHSALNSLQKQYDAQTTHGTVPEKQSAWEEKIGKGL